MRRKVWFEPGIAPGVGLRAVVLRRRRFFAILNQVQVLFRDLNDQCYKTWVTASNSELDRV